MEEHGVALGHVQLDLVPGVHAPDAVVHAVDGPVLRVVVPVQLALVGAGLDDQTAVTGVDPLHGRPGCHDPVLGPEGEVVKVLVQGVTGGPRP